MSSSPVNQKAAAKLDRIREREMFRYFQPNIVSSRGKFPLLPTDTTLTALAQLVALKLDCQSVLVNIIGKNTQFTLTEGTRTLDIGEAPRLPNAENGLWVGCGGMDKERSICQHAVTLPMEPGNKEFLIIPDLREDERTRAFDYVQGSPHWRFYWGVPLITKAGIPIGALCILDNKVRHDVTAEQRHFCRTMASVMMEHLETLREVTERKKGMRLSQGLNAFVQGKTTIDAEPDSKLELETLLHKYHSLGPVTTVANSGVTSPIADAESYNQPHIDRAGPSLESIGSVQRSRSLSTTSDVESVSELATPKGWTTTDDSYSHQPDHSIEAERVKVFQRAAALLQQSLDIKEHGGVVFLDTSLGFASYDQDLETLPASPDESAANTLHTPAGLPRYDKSSTRISSTYEISRGSGNHERAAEVLSLSRERSSESDDSPMNSYNLYKPVSEQLIQQLLMHYPKGHLWSFDDVAGSFSSDSDSSHPLHDKSVKSGESKRGSKTSETAQLQRAFVGVRQLLFKPQWDAQLGNYSSCCFCWTTSEQQVFSAETELNFLAAFSNCVMAEMSRLSSIHANQQKSAFISSISHELRSPLHGILACAEFLAETTLDPFQSNLVDTINASGRTLHQTIEHVLDFAKINAFERSLRKAKKNKGLKRSNSIAGRGTPLDHYSTPMLNIYAVVDVAAVAEEVVQGTYAASEFDAYSSTEMASATALARGRTANRGLNHGMTSIFTGGALSNTAKRVEVILDIDRGDYTFTTQQGALRRLIMNLLGNSLKYTEKGRITVKLSLVDGAASPETTKPTKVLVLRVIDTGKGISPEYLRTQLFTPFAQENSLAPGTGLGLSIVKSIVAMLGGAIEVRSQLNKGTEVKVTIPLASSEGQETPINTPSSTLSGTGQEDSISILRAQAINDGVATYGFDGDSNAKEMGRVLVHYLNDWFGLDVIADSAVGPTPKIIITDENNLAALLARGTSARNIVVFCTSSSRYHHNNILQAEQSHTIEFCAKPFGPYRLAKILRTCLERGNGVQSNMAAATDSARENLVESAFVVPTPELSNLSLRQINDATTLLEPGTLLAAPTENAHMALGSCEGDSSTVTAGPESKGVDFPFPTQSTDEPISTDLVDSNLVRRPSKPTLRSSQIGPDATPTTPQVFGNDPVSTPRKSSNGVKQSSTERPDDEVTFRPKTKSGGITFSRVPTTKSKASAVRQKETVEADGATPRQPRILVVDDNKINLLLLQTFMKKRKYKLIDSAENGHLAVKAAEKCKSGYDVIFMDISMPIMNGFEATRRIRQLESVRCGARSSQTESQAETIAARLAALPYELPPGLIPTLSNGSMPSMKPQSSPTYTPALIIALTGLASQQDQSEAFSSGIDLYMTKPVSFKEVGKLLDNWEANSSNDHWEENDGGDEMGIGA